MQQRLLQVMTMTTDDLTQQILQELKLRGGPFDVDMQAKAEIAGCYIRDGDDLLELFRMGWQSDRNNRSYRSKLFVNLRMAIECFLKGLIIVHSDPAESL